MNKITNLINNFKEEHFTGGYNKTPEKLYELILNKLTEEELEGEIITLSQNAEKSVLIDKKHLLVLRSQQKYCPVQEVPILIKLAQLQIKSATILKFNENDVTEKHINI